MQTNPNSQLTRPFHLYATVAKFRMFADRFFYKSTSVALMVSSRSTLSFN
jgi:hypothetical protein